MLTYHLWDIYFSAPASFLIMRSNAARNRVVYGTSARQAMSEKWMSFWAAEFFEIVLLEQNCEIPYTWTAYPHCLELVSKHGKIATFAFDDHETLLFEANGVDVRFVPLKPYKAHYQTGDGVLNLVDTGTQLLHQFVAGEETELITPAVGTVEFQGKGIHTRGAFRLIAHEAFWEHTAGMCVHEAAQKYAAQFECWLQRMPAVPAQYQETAEKALFLLWSCQVPAQGPLTRRPVFSSKAAMNGIWSWDNCFHALALAEVDAELAWDQLLLLFDHQAESGVLPDVIDDKRALYGYTKPPIYGWTIRKLVTLLGVEASLPYLSRLYTPLCRLTEWWYRQRGTASGMCCYYDGNDSGWDNATVFDTGEPVEGVDLAAYLVLQMEALSFMARLLGFSDAAQIWQNRANDQLRILLSVGFQDGRFQARTVHTDKPTSSCSLLNMVPVILGKRIPSAILSTIVTDLRPGGPFFTAYGLASESPQSPAYTADGYWRGPIWAPPTYQIVDGLSEAGEIHLARQIAHQYCAMVARDSAFYENYNALTGEGLRCPGVCWTAAVFLRLAAWLQENQAAAEARVMFV